MDKEDQSPMAGIYRLAEVLDLKLSPGEKHILEALVRSSPDTFPGTSTTIIDQVLDRTQRLIEGEKQRTRELMEHAVVDESAAKPQPPKHETVIRKWLAAKQSLSSSDAVSEADQLIREVLSEQIRHEVKAAVAVQMKGLAEQVESALERLSEQHAECGQS
ncbi:hypothetical protein HUS84_34240 [Pseudomonas chlororaphis]|uniref:hypothetical protein n=1 Tax=Pseudomonas chlororaphis TaxID=587753 RepID=UPI001B33B517|nr:hypothetical protein [Pseudomonas chlororaphis]MBP5073021.1 hypothetical protein [Pseudomonas chlororaphis]MBP5078827.1 hypothetical protein [Pseudomonas chlororaphis]